MAAAYKNRVSLFHGPAFALPKFAAFKRVVTLHDFGFLRHPQWVAPDVRDYLRRMVPQAISVADGIIVPSPGILEELYEFFPTVRGRHVAIIPMGSEFAEHKYEGVTALTPPIDRPYILHVGTLEPRKNLGTLVKAYEKLARLGMPHVLVLVGNNPNVGSSVIDNLDPRIIVTGYVSRSDLAAWYAHASLYVQASWYEGFGMGTLEAYLWGIPIVASRTGWVVQLAESSDYPAVLIDDASDPEALFRAMERGISLGKEIPRSPDRCKGFTWVDIVHRHWYFYEEVVNGT
ncbi:MAG: glycosyltransferase family 4 protein [Firmicutes bacterium]|nr:glycosyltransferase family 4 protein [Alicyclobacillaceae bacterium]MCL6497435.1 glycosyltransferase family 4 protein [Bacillota bacterium]